MIPIDARSKGLRQPSHPLDWTVGTSWGISAGLRRTPGSTLAAKTARFHGSGSRILAKPPRERANHQPADHCRSRENPHDNQGAENQK